LDLQESFTSKGSILKILGCKEPQHQGLRDQRWRMETDVWIIRLITIGVTLSICFSRETILVGFTTKSDAEINQVIQQLSKEFTGDSYTLLTRYGWESWKDYLVVHVVGNTFWLTAIDRLFLKYV